MVTFFALKMIWTFCTTRQPACDGQYTSTSMFSLLLKDTTHFSIISVSLQWREMLQYGYGSAHHARHDLSSDHMGSIITSSRFDVS